MRNGWTLSDKEINISVKNVEQVLDLHIPTSSLAGYQRGAYYYGIRAFNHLSPNIKSLSNEVRLFTSALKRVLLIHFIP
jgi:hypothetical protein